MDREAGFPQNSEGRCAMEDWLMSKAAIQDQIPGNHCFGCGTLNADGLQIKSYWDGDGTVCTFHPAPHHAAGPTNIFNGGIIATIIDCHGVCTAIAHAYRRENRAIGTAPEIWCVTAGMTIKYIKPTPIDHPVTLRGRIEKDTGKRITAACDLFSGDTLCAQGTVDAVQVAEDWRA
jgi:acyl-coenzyme A thioesterase PaaI-like protein